VVGLASGLGAASADAFYGSLSALGLTLISNLLLDLQTPLRLFGGLFLLWLGWRTFRAQPADPAADVGEKNGLCGAYLSTLALTLTNPVTILAFAALFASVSPLAEDSPAWMGGVVVLGVFIGSALWWLSLSTGVSFLRGALDRRHLVWVNRVSGAVILGFALSTLASLL
jgi:threonine/homoserine/homoserine lactone efflux protein